MSANAAGPARLSAIYDALRAVTVDDAEGWTTLGLMYAAVNGWLTGAGREAIPFRALEPALKRAGYRVSDGRVTGLVLPWWKGRR
ncbi:hypothetical protein [Streptomyces sp. NPDC050546]|uniref:hypothetical protein n=1 Tax=Streptomyces sp. NPDC050546 TaxID=3365628 RepID=UPI0037B93546